MTIPSDEPKSADEKLRASELTYRRLFEAANDGILIIDLKTGRITDVNPALIELLCFSREEILGKTVGELSPFKDTAANQAMLERLQKDGSVRYEDLPLESKDGRSIAVEFVCNVYQAGDEKVIQCNVRDITARRKVETDLRKSEGRFRRMFTAAGTGIAISTPQGRFLQANAAYCKMLGYTEAELLERDFASLTHPEDLTLNLKLRDEMLAGKREDFVMEKRYLKKSGETVWTRHSVSSARTVNGTIETLIVIAEDITERKRTEARFRRLVDSNVQAVLFWNNTGDIIDGNDAFLKIAGYTREDLQAGRINWAAMTPPEYAERDQHALEEIAATGISSLYEKEWIRKNGSRVPILLGSAVFEDNPNEGVCFVLDLTERKKVEEQLRLSQKMESIGTLAGGIAHDFNNFLTIIQMQTHLFKSSGELTPDQLKYIEVIDTSAQHSSALTRQLLLFSRKQTTQFREINLSQSIGDMSNIIRRAIGEDIELQLKLSSLPLFIHGDAGMIDQVLMNLVVNSRDAMPKGGKLIIETSTVEFDEKSSSQIPRARVGSFVSLSVTDSGCGIPKENISKIFEPFFTTKEVGKGTGLGLSTLFGIVQQLNGWVNVYSEVDQGTTLRVYLPRLVSSSAQEQEPIQNTERLSGNETILYVEDDEFLRNAVCRILSQFGYRVLAAKASAEALEIWSKHSHEIRLLLTDLVMPGKMSGKELGDRLLTENPKLKVIFSSGYSVEIAGKDFNLEEGSNFLSKPFQAHKLARTVRDSLDK